MINYNYKYLEDKNFLKQLDLEEFKTHHVRIGVRDFHTERLIANIEGKATGGTVNLSGSSNVRRTMSSSLLVDPDGIRLQGHTNSIRYSNITEVENLISMNKKVSVEIGFKNTLAPLGRDYYPEYNIIWIPLGLFIVKSANVAKSNSGLNISLTLNDKTALLNGDVGGVIPAATVFSENALYNTDATSRTVEHALIKDIIKHIVIDFGGEDPSNIIIEDIPDSIVKVMKWTDKKPLYLYNINGSYFYDTDVPIGANITRTFEYGEDVGFTNEPFIYPGTLECSAGETAAAMLDKIKNVLGNYEWFYDINGRFHFQEKKNYLNTSHATKVSDLSEQGYLSTINMSKSVYTFDANNKSLLTNISNSPQYQNIKNDFVVWGSTKTASGAEKPIRYHLAFDTKPTIKDEERLCVVYTDYRDLQQVIVLTEENSSFTIGEDKDKYYLVQQDNKYSIVHWDNEYNIFREFDKEHDGWELCYLKTDDWRTELYLQGLESTNKTFVNNYYSAELNAEWPKIYNVRKSSIATKNLNGINLTVYAGGYIDELNPVNYEYFLDFIEGSESGSRNLSQFNVNNIGRRTKVGKDNNANCIFATEVPSYIIVEADGDVADELEEINKKGQTAVQVSPEVFSKLAFGGGKVSAYDKVKELLYQYTNYNESISLTTIPIYYLEPNTLITIADNDVSVNGNYIINTISLPLAIGTSTISCIKAISKEI